MRCDIGLHKVALMKPITDFFIPPFCLLFLYTDAK